MNEHAYYMPSGAGEWGPCPAAATALNTLPSPERERTRQGSAAHWLAAECLTKAHDPLTYLGQKASNGIIIDTEIIEGVSIYVNEVLLNAVFAPRNLLVECRVNMPDIHPDCWGTLDAGVIISDTLYIWDYKHGFAEVSPERSKQLALYAKGVLNAVPDFTPRKIVFSIVQPFAYNADGPVRYWECTLSDLIPMWGALHTSAHADRRHAVAGPHCRYCRARHRCNVRRETDYRYMDASACPVDFEDMDTRALATEYQLLTEHMALVKSRVEATADELEHRVKNGDTTSGLSMGSKAGRLEWSRSPPAIHAALSVLGVDARQEGCKTPRQVALSLPAAERDHFYQTIKPLTKRRYSLKLTNTSDTIAGRAFSKRS